MTHATSPSEEKTSVGLSEIFLQHLRRYFDFHEYDLPPEGLYDRILKEMERPLLEETLSRVGYNQIKAAKILGINRNTLRKKIKELNISMDTLR